MIRVSNIIFIFLEQNGSWILLYSFALLDSLIFSASYVILCDVCLHIHVWAKNILMLPDVITYVSKEFIIPNKSHSFVIQLCLRSRIGLWEKILLRSIWHHALFFLRCQCGVYKYCCSVLGTVCCRGKVRSANCARTLSKESYIYLYITNTQR